VLISAARLSSGSMRSLAVSIHSIIAAVVSGLAACSTQPAPSSAAAPTTLATPATSTTPPAGPSVMVAASASPRLSELAAPSLRALPEPAITLPMRESFSVQQPGDAPRSVRRYALQPRERRYQIAATLRARVLGTAGADDRAKEVPPFREDFAVQAAPSSTGAILHWRGEPSKATADPAATAPYLARWNVLLAGRRASVTFDDHGGLGEISFAEDPLRQHSGAETDELSQRLLGLAVPLPSVPIGLGARWRAVTVLRQGVGVVKQTASYELVAQDGPTLTLAIDVKRVAEEQRVEAPGMPAGTTVDLVAMFRRVTGRVEVRLDEPLPVRGDLSIEARAHQRVHLPSGAGSETVTEDLGALTLSSERP
jgi:hypothetical protein